MYYLSNPGPIIRIVSIGADLPQDEAPEAVNEALESWLATLEK